MIVIGDAACRINAQVLTAPGGFLWWYVDLIDERGSGLVLIWSFGLPFLPGYADAARRGAAQRPIDRPSLNLALYDRGRLACYLLQELDPAEAVWEPGADRWRFGDSRLRSRLDNGALRVTAFLNCPLPATSERLIGRLELEGVARRSDDPAGLAVPSHCWTPLSGPCRGWASISVGETLRFTVEGRAYHDRNSGGVPLHDLGIREWTWGRLPFPDQERIYYLLWPADRRSPPTALGLEIDASGGTRILPALEVRCAGRRRSIYGPRWWSRLELLESGRRWLSLRLAAPVEDGPFYLRFIVDGEGGGLSGRGWGEVVAPERIDRALHRPFVRMRVHDLRSTNSIWLPLFNGPMAGRYYRTLRQLWWDRRRDEGGPSNEADGIQPGWRRTTWLSRRKSR